MWDLDKSCEISVENCEISQDSVRSQTLLLYDQSVLISLAHQLYTEVQYFQIICHWCEQKINKFSSGLEATKAQWKSQIKFPRPGEEVVLSEPFLAAPYLPLLVTDRHFRNLERKMKSYFWHLKHFRFFIKSAKRQKRTKKRIKDTKKTKRRKEEINKERKNKETVLQKDKDQNKI